MSGIIDITRRESQLTVVFKGRSMELCGIRNGKVELELMVDLFPYSFHQSLKHAIDRGETTHPFISLPFGKKHHFWLERHGGLKNDEVWFTLKTTTNGFFAIELRAQEIKNLVDEMRGHMTR